MKPWERSLQLAVEDFLGDVADAIRETMKREQPPRPQYPKTDTRHEQRVERAWKTLERICGQTCSERDADCVRTWVRRARLRSHPDCKKSKSSRDFLLVQRAAETLSHHYGVKL